MSAYDFVIYRPGQGLVAADPRIDGPYTKQLMMARSWTTAEAAGHFCEDGERVVPVAEILFTPETP